MRNIYISGPITGVDNWKEIFNAKARELRAAFPDDHIANPVDISELTEQQARDTFCRKPTYNEYMAQDLRLLCQCDCIYMLAGWQKSKGARLENHVAKTLGLEVLGAEE